ncbi:hypothetical protein M0E87_01805 [Corynebacterium sp. CCM 9185]|uniref:hypothetical protein n=1 Tax=Corynebacterium marambiense TaxID=2765364 RepID=UPI001E617346|nr:hypothetical protein [Corynebacterium marambiense]MCK7662405.1 hypothetical protein [Corynebacterium marambiense]MCX7541691.1 hypothetical protein [Corynebacterium marambiense]
MSEKKLTVAELMARAAAEEGKGEDCAPRRRRRRRSLDEGGVSVAELTGSIPAVESKPAESRHSSVPLDTADRDSEETPVPDAGSRHSASVADEAATSVTVPAPPAVVGGEGAETPEENAGGSAGSDADKAPTTAETTPTDAPGKPAESGSAPESTRPSSDETVVLSVVTDDDPIRLTTGEFPSITPRQIQQERASAPSPVGTPEAPEETPDAASGVPTPAIAVDEAPPTTSMDTITAGDAGMPSADGIAPSDTTPEGEDAVAGQEKVSVVAVIGMILLGLIVGVALFFGFEKLWGHFDTAITAVLAIAVTCGIIGVVHALRTERDGLSMFLAGLAGLAVTFGPLLTA